MTTSVGTHLNRNLKFEVHLEPVFEGKKCSPATFHAQIQGMMLFILQIYLYNAGIFNFSMFVVI